MYLFYFDAESRETTPLYLSDANDGGMMDLLLFRNHYVYVPDVKRIVKSSQIDLPFSLSNPAKGIINPKNPKDQESFRWCHIIHKHPELVHPERVSVLRKYINEVVYSGIEFPVSKKDYPIIERQNNISINVFCFEDGKIKPHYVSNGRDLEDQMDLLLVRTTKSVIDER